jgi:hypothetical protein
MANWVQHHKEYNFTPEHHQDWKHTNADVYSNEVGWQSP